MLERNHTHGRAYWTRVRLVAILVALGMASATRAQDGDASVPKYLQIARDFAANTKPENNSYSNRNPYTRMPGDFLAREYVVSTDCSRFVEDMFRRGKSGVAEQLRSKSLKNSYSIHDWQPSIERGEPEFDSSRHFGDVHLNQINELWLKIQNSCNGTFLDLLVYLT